jgi:hypothetical protein
MKIGDRVRVINAGEGYAEFYNQTGTITAIEGVNHYGVTFDAPIRFIIRTDAYWTVLGSWLEFLPPDVPTPETYDID